MEIKPSQTEAQSKPDSKASKPHKISRRTAIKLGAAATAATLGLTNAGVVPEKIVAAQSTIESPGAANPTEGIVLKGEEREARIKQLGSFLQEFVTPEGFSLLADRGIYKDNDVEVTLRENSSSEAILFHRVMGGLKEQIAVFENSRYVRVRELNLFTSKPKDGMDGFAEDVKSLLKFEEAQFKDELEGDSTTEDLEQAASGYELLKTGNQIVIEPFEKRSLRADIPPPDNLIKNPDLNEYFHATDNFVRLDPRGLITFKQQWDMFNTPSEKLVT